MALWPLFYQHYPIFKPTVARKLRRVVLEAHGFGPKIRPQIVKKEPPLMRKKPLHFSDEPPYTHIG